MNLPPLNLQEVRYAETDLQMVADGAGSRWPSRRSGFPDCARARHTPPQEKSKSRIPNPFGGSKDKDKDDKKSSDKLSKASASIRRIKAFSQDLFVKMPIS